MYKIVNGKIQDDIILERITLEHLNKCQKLPMVTLYSKTLDYPNHFSARIFDIDQPTVYVVLGNSVDELRKLIPYHMTPVCRDPKDDRVILETYM